MKKIPTLYLRDFDGTKGRYVLPILNDEAAWVLDGQGIATRKLDGTCVMLMGPRWFSRREVGPGREPPAQWHPISHDYTTGKRIGWEPIEQSSFHEFFLEAWLLERVDRPWVQGTYELVGPKINKNPERVPTHQLIKHGSEILSDVPTDFFELWNWLHTHPYEGVVWHGPGGTMAKIKAKDFPLGGTP